jgi:hypothetical protein
VNNYVALLVSLVVALLTTGGSTAALHQLGRVLRDNKDHQRRLDLKQFTASTAIGVVMVLVLVTAIATVAFHRVWREGQLSGLDNLALLLAGLVALVMFISSGLVYWNAFRDGSLEQDDLAHYSKLAIKYSRKEQRYGKRRQKLCCELEALGGHVETVSSARPPDGGGQILRLPDAHES